MSMNARINPWQKNLSKLSITLIYQTKPIIISKDLEKALNNIQYSFHCLKIFLFKLNWERKGLPNLIKSFYQKLIATIINNDDTLENRNRKILLPI